MSVETIFFLYLAGIPLLGMISQWLAWRLKLPSILLLLGVGVALGAFVTPDELLEKLTGSSGAGNKILLPIVSLSVAVILFEGGMTLRFRELDSSDIIFRLVIVGAVVAWALGTFGAVYILGFDFRIALLIGAILVVTGPTVVAPLLRHIRPTRRVSSVVKWEGIVIDPIGAVLAVLVFEQVIAEAGHTSVTGMVSILLKTALVGGAIGFVTAWILVKMVRRFWVPDFLQGVLFLAAAIASFAISNVLQEESGLVTVTVLGMVLANQKQISVHHVLEFEEHLRVLLISCLFIVLGSRLNPSDILQLGLPGFLFLIFLVVVVRPASIMISTVGSSLEMKERIFLCCLAPRGIVAAAVASVFALEVIHLASEEEVFRQLATDAERLVPITFLVIVGTVSIYGLLAAPIARRLGLADSNPQGVLFASAEPWVRELANALLKHKQQVLLVDTNYANVAAAKMAGIPAECASILSEHIVEETDLAGIGRLLAVTANDEVNTLAVREFTHVFGSANVYQLPAPDASSGPRASVASHLKGRVLFDSELTHEDFIHYVERGMIVKTTTLTDSFSWDDFLERYGENTKPLFILTSSDVLKIGAVDDPLAPGEGDTVFCFVHEAD